MSTHEIRLPWPKPPLSLNDRSHWAIRSRKTKNVRAVGCAFVKAAHIPTAARISVTLTYHPRDARRRDEDNVVATFKALCDGIVDAAVVPDDTPQYMAKHMPIIGTPNPKDPHLVLTIETLEEA